MRPRIWSTTPNVIAVITLVASTAGAVPPLPGPASGPPRPFAGDLASSSACARCHADIAAEWRGSLHRQSFTDPVFQRGYALEREPFCRGCHAPTADPAREPTAAAADEGVGCTTCHVSSGAVTGAQPSAGRAHACDGSGTCGGCTPTVSGVSPLNVTLDKPTTFTITGQCLPSTIAPFIPECANLVVLTHDPTQATFACTPSYTTGVKAGVIKDKPGGTQIGAFNVTVQPCTPSYSGISPTSVPINQLATFTITGQCLPSTIAPFIPECANLTVLTHDPTQAIFQCKPSFTTGVKAGVVKDKPGGTQFGSFNITVY